MQEMCKKWPEFINILTAVFFLFMIMNNYINNRVEPVFGVESNEYMCVFLIKIYSKCPEGVNLSAISIIIIENYDHRVQRDVNQNGFLLIVLRFLSSLQHDKLFDPALPYAKNLIVFFIVSISVIWLYSG